VRPSWYGVKHCSPRSHPLGLLSGCDPFPLLLFFHFSLFHEASRPLSPLKKTAWRMSFSIFHASFLSPHSASITRRSSSSSFLPVCLGSCAAAAVRRLALRFPFSQHSLSFGSFTGSPLVRCFPFFFRLPAKMNSSPKEGWPPPAISPQSFAPCSPVRPLFLGAAPPVGARPPNLRNFLSFLLTFLLALVFFSPDSASRYIGPFFPGWLPFSTKRHFKSSRFKGFLNLRPPTSPPRTLKLVPFSAVLSQPEELVIYSSFFIPFFFFPCASLIPRLSSDSSHASLISLPWLTPLKFFTPAAFFSFFITAWLSVLRAFFLSPS